MKEAINQVSKGPYKSDTRKKELERGDPARSKLSLRTIVDPTDS
jgi:hypothetical protein